MTYLVKEIIQQTSLLQEIIT